MTTKEKAREVWYAIRGDPEWVARNEEFSAAFAAGDEVAAGGAIAALAEAFDAAEARLLAEITAEDREVIGVEVNLLAARSCGAI